MVSAAVQRVLDRRDDRAAIGSLSSLRDAYEQELVVYDKEIAAHVDQVLAIERAMLRNITTKWIADHRPCAECGGPIGGAKRLSRWFCSDACRQRAHRKRRQTAS